MKLLRQTALEWMTEREEASKRGDYIPDDILTHMMRLRGNLDVKHNLFRYFKSHYIIEIFVSYQINRVVYTTNSFTCEMHLNLKWVIIIIVILGMRQQICPGQSWHIVLHEDKIMDISSHRITIYLFIIHAHRLEHKLWSYLSHLYKYQENIFFL